MPRADVVANALLAVATCAGILGVVGVGVHNLGLGSTSMTTTGLVLVGFGSVCMSGSFAARARAVRARPSEKRRYLAASFVWLIPSVLVALRVLLNVRLTTLLWLPILVLAFATFVVLLYSDRVTD
jgi:hypothetical protein